MTSMPVRQELLDTNTLTLNSYRDAYRKAFIAGKQWQIPLSNGIVQSKWHRENWDKIHIGEASLQKIVDFKDINSSHWQK